MKAPSNSTQFHKHILNTPYVSADAGGWQDV